MSPRSKSPYRAQDDLPDSAFNGAEGRVRSDERTAAGKALHPMALEAKMNTKTAKEPPSPASLALLTLTLECLFDSEIKMDEERRK